MKTENKRLRSLPSVDALLKSKDCIALVRRHGRRLVTHAVRAAIGKGREALLAGKPAPDEQSLVVLVSSIVNSIAGVSLRRVINATGVVLHTNLGRAVLGDEAAKDLAGVITGYCNVEFDCAAGKRGSRHDHTRELLAYLTGAEDSLVVNNNAAGILLALSVLAKRKEVIVSRGELIEIGGEFRIPDIMAAAGCRMVEVGTTNRTRIADYEKAVTPNTAVIFKAHRSNFAMKGFVEEASLAQCAGLAAARGLTFVYDIGSGLIRRPRLGGLENEPDVAGAIAAGADLVLFSGDKLLGGPQAGIIAGKRELIQRLAKAPLMRALRVGKLTVAALSAACRSFLDDDSLVKTNPVFGMLSRSPTDCRRLADLLAGMLEGRGVSARVVDSGGQCGGGTLPEFVIPSAAVALVLRAGGRADGGRRVFEALLRRDLPVVGVLREGVLCFDMLTVQEGDIPAIADAVAAACGPEGR